MMILSGVYWYSIDVNPEPWAVGNVGVNRRGGKVSAYMGQNKQLAAYQDAIRESIKYNTFVKMEGDLSVSFYFWRRTDDYETASGKRHRKHIVDATNMQKGTEDALQGILFDNDKNNRHVQSYIMEQGPDVKGMIVISVQQFRALPKLPTPIERSIDIMKLDNYERQSFVEEERPAVDDIF